MRNGQTKFISALSWNTILCYMVFHRVMFQLFAARKTVRLSGRYTSSTMNKDKKEKSVVKRKCRCGCRLRSIQLADARETSGCFKKTRECRRYLGLLHRSVANHRSEYNNGFQDYPRPTNFVLFFIFDRRRKRNTGKSIKNKI